MGENLTFLVFELCYHNALGSGNIIVMDNNARTLESENMDV